MTDTLAYRSTALDTVVKSFIEEAKTNILFMWQHVILSGVILPIDISSTVVLFTVCMCVCFLSGWVGVGVYVVYVCVHVVCMCVCVYVCMCVCVYVCMCVCVYVRMCVYMTQ